MLPGLEPDYSSFGTGTLCIVFVPRPLLRRSVFVGIDGRATHTRPDCRPAVDFEWCYRGTGTPATQVSTEEGEGGQRHDLRTTRPQYAVGIVSPDYRLSSSEGRQSIGSRSFSPTPSRRINLSAWQQWRRQVDIVTYVGTFSTGPTRRSETLG